MGVAWSKLSLTRKISIVIVLLSVFVGCSVFFVYYNDPCSNIAVISITGEVTPSPLYTDNGTLRQDTTITLDLVSKIRKSDQDQRVKALAFIIDSQGGDGEEEVTRAIQETHKPTVALIRSQGLSSAYWIASATGRIFALPVSEVGAIGVTGSYTDNARKNENDGLTFNQLSVGKFKDAGNPDKPLTADEKQMFMSGIQDVYGIFINEVSQNRHLPIEQVQAIADGSAILGDSALKKGLIDEIGSFADVDRYLSKILKRKVRMCI